MMIIKRFRLQQTRVYCRLSSDWKDGFNRKFARIKAEMRWLYLRDKKPFLVTFSSGKDSSLVLTLAWEMIASLPSGRRHKPIHVISGDTRAEEPKFAEFLRRSLVQIEMAAESLNLPFIVRRSRPDVTSSAFYKVIGKGLPLPTPASRFRWCSDHLKIRPNDKVIDEIVPNRNTNEHDALLLTGVRRQESNKRAASIEKFSIKARFARHSTRKNILMYQPIEFLHTDDIWIFLIQKGILPWGIAVEELGRFYENDFNECSLVQIDEKGQGKACGSSGSRTGCWICMYSQKDGGDKMLDRLIDGGDESLVPLRDFKRFMTDIRNDVRLREAVTRREYAKVLKRVEQAKIPSLLDLCQSEYESFQRANDWDISAQGPMAFEARLMLLQKLLYTQFASGHKLIEQEEFDAILNVWREDGYEVNPDDLVPRDWKMHEGEWNYTGAIVLKPDATLNVEKTTNVNKIFTLWEDFLLGKDELILFLRERSRKTRKNLFYSLTYSDMREHWGTDDDFVWNQAQFLIAEPNIETEEQARDFLHSWLGYNESPQQEPTNWGKIADDLYQDACRYAAEPDFDPERLSYMNQSLEALGYRTVQPPLNQDEDGQLQFSWVA